MRVTAPMAALAAAALLAGCAGEERVGTAGDLDTGQLGSAVRENLALMSGEQSMIVDLTRTFAAAVPSRITFAFDSARLSAEARAALRRQAVWIRRHPGVRFRVFGHTDKVGSRAYNERLGLRRARAAVAYLVARGAPRARLEAVVSKGETQPLVLTSGRSRRNRRTVTEVSGFARTAGMTFDGKYMHRVYEAYVDSALPPHNLDFELDSPGGGGGSGGG